MKKEVYKLILVFIMIVFSFSLAFFLGREVTLSNKKNTEELPVTNQKTEQTDKPFVTPVPKNLFPEKATQREKVQQYKETLPSKTETTKNADKKEKPQETTEEIDTIYGLLISSYDNKSSAMEQSTQIKIRFPQWKVFFKKSQDSYKVYIGPFKKKEVAQKFLKELKKKSEFSYVKLEKI